MRDLPLDPLLLDVLDWGLTTDRNPQHEALKAAVDQLPKRLRDVVEAVFYEQVSKRGLARRLGVSRDEIERRLKEAYARLKEASVSAANGVGALPAEDAGHASPVSVPRSVARTSTNGRHVPPQDRARSPRADG